MLRVRVHQFATNEAGAGTVMGLLWFALLVGITGVAFDVTDGFRNRTMLQATADSAALAGAIDLPDESAAVATAVTYAADNIGAGKNASVLDPADVHVGLWDAATQSLDQTAALPDAVMVTLRRSARNAGPVPADVLRMAGLRTYNVTTRAVAQRFIPECLRDGLIARGIVDMSSNNGLVNQVCVHGNEGVNIRSNNRFETGVTVSMASLAMLKLPDSGMDSNIGLPDALHERHLDPRMVNHVDEIMLDMLDPASPVMPSYIDTDLPVIVVDDEFRFDTYVQGRIYQVRCDPNKQVSIPANTSLSNVVIISQCGIGVGANTSLSNVVLGSTALGDGAAPLDKASIEFSANVELGAADDCAPGGGVQIFSSASVHFSSSMTVNGVQIVAAGDVDLGARDMGVNGISVQAGQDISLTSDNMFGLCSGGAPGLFTAPYYRLVL